MISPSKGRYDMLLLQPVATSLHMTTYIQETGEPPRTAKVQTLRTMQEVCIRDAIKKDWFNILKWDFVKSCNSCK